MVHSCRLALSIFLFSPTHNVLHKTLILHLRAFISSYKYRILSNALADVSDDNRERACSRLSVVGDESENKREKNDAGLQS